MDTLKSYDKLKSRFSDEQARTLVETLPELRDAGIRGHGDAEMGNIRSYKELRVYQAAMEAAMCVFELTKGFPAEEKFSLVDQMRRSSRSVCANIAEAWRKRPYQAHFVSKLSDAESEAEETRVWPEFACRCGYLTNAQASL